MKVLLTFFVCCFIIYYLVAVVTKVGKHLGNFSRPEDYWGKDV